jgi:hypothetical protein
MINIGKEWRWMDNPTDHNVLNTNTMRKITEEDMEYRQGRSVSQVSETYKLMFLLFTVGIVTVVLFGTLTALGLF